MIKSMTGFGNAERISGDWTVRAELRSVNHKELKVSFRVPDAFRAREIKLQNLLERKLQRGHVYFDLDCELRSARPELLIDRERVGRYIQALKELAEENGVPFRADLAGILGLPDALPDVATDEELQESLWPDVKAVTGEAVDALVEMRRAEGANLAEQLNDIAARIESLVDDIEGRQAEFLLAHRDHLRERIERLLEDTEAEPDEDSLAREAARFADRSDVSEEIARLRSHVQQFREALAVEGEPVGRKMEFIGQEMLREAGTIGAKNPSDQQVPQVLELKTQVERLREQVRNVE